MVLIVDRTPQRFLPAARPERTAPCADRPRSGRPRIPRRRSCRLSRCGSGPSSPGPFRARGRPRLPPSRAGGPPPRARDARRRNGAKYPSKKSSLSASASSSRWSSASRRRVHSLSRAREPLGPARVLSLHLRQHPAADPVPREALVLVRLVLAVGNASFREELPELGAREGEERTDDAVAPARADPSAAAAESPLEVEQDRLGLVVARVAGEDGSAAEAAREGEERRVPQAAGRGLGALALPPPGRHVHGAEREGHRKLRGEPRAEPRVLVARLAPEAVRDVRRHHRDAAGRRPRGGEEEKRRGVAPARMRHDERVARPRRGAPPRRVGRSGPRAAPSSCAIIRPPPGPPGAPFRGGVAQMARAGVS